MSGISCKPTVVYNCQRPGCCPGGDPWIICGECRERWPCCKFMDYHVAAIYKAETERADRMMAEARQR